VTERNSARAGRRGLSSDTEKEQDEDQRQRCAQEPEKNESHDDPPFGVIGCKDRTPPSGVTQLGLQLCVPLVGTPNLEQPVRATRKEIPTPTNFPWKLRSPSAELIRRSMSRRCPGTKISEGHGKNQQVSRRG
jgi:hypothetical protein